MGLLPNALKTQRTWHFRWHPTPGTVHCLLLQSHRCVSATQFWDGGFDPGLLGRTHKAWVDRSLKPSWNGVHGPLGAVITSLRRIGWSLEKGVAIRSDTDELINVLLSVVFRDGSCAMRLGPWPLTHSKPPTSGFVTCVTCCIRRRSWSACESQHVTSPWSSAHLQCPGRMTALNLRTDPSCSLCLISGTHAQGCFPLPLVVSTHGFLSERGLRRHVLVLVPWDSKCAPTFGARPLSAGGCKLGSPG